MSVTNDDFPDETLAFREYVLILADGSRVSMAITLGDPQRTVSRRGLPGRTTPWPMA
jgi:hypothetical protein